MLIFFCIFMHIRSNLWSKTFLTDYLRHCLGKIKLKSDSLVWSGKVKNIQTVAVDAVVFKCILIILDVMQLSSQVLHVICTHILNVSGVFKKLCHRGTRNPFFFWMKSQSMEENLFLNIRVWADKAWNSVHLVEINKFWTTVSLNKLKQTFFCLFVTYRKFKLWKFNSKCCQNICQHVRSPGGRPDVRHRRECRKLQMCCKSPLLKR